MFLLAVAALFLAIVSFFKSWFVHRESNLRHFETRLGYALRWGVYRWMMAIIYLAASVAADIGRSLARQAGWYIVTHDIYLYLTDSRSIIDQEARHAYLKKHMRRPA